MRQRLLAAFASLALLLVAAGAALAATPVANDDPDPSCSGLAAFGGNLPIVEDFRASSPQAPGVDWFIIGGPCAGLLDNDQDADGPMTYELVDGPTHGDVMKVDDQFTAYRPDPDYSTRGGDQPGGTWTSDSFTYRACDAAQPTDCSTPATMRIWLAPVNDAPSFTPGAGLVTVDQDSGPYSGAWASAISPGPNEAGQSVRFEVDTDLNGVPNLFTVPPAISPSGTLTFTPRAGEVGLVHVTVRARDDGGLEDYGSSAEASPVARDTSDPVTFDLVVQPVEPPADLPPVAVDDDASTNEDVAVDIDVLANDTDPDGDSLTIASVSQPARGSASIAGNKVHYVPTPNSNGEDSFSYTVSDGRGGQASASVTVHVVPQNDPPVATGEAVTTDEDIPIDIDVLANDTDPDGDTLSISDPGTPSLGAVSVVDGKIRYVPTRDAAGVDTFAYTAADGHGGSASASVTVTITARNDPPTADDDEVGVAEDSDYTDIHPLAGDGDVDGDTLSITGVTQPAHGASQLASSSVVRYRPNHDFSGPDTFTYAISDGNGGTATGTITVIVGGTSDPPVAVADSFTLDEGAPATELKVLDNDVDPDGDELRIASVTKPAHGTLVLSPTAPFLTYRPTPGFHGADSFDYKVDDQHGSALQTAHVFITVVRDAAPPIVVAPAYRFVGQTVGSSTTRVRVSWSASDAGSGLSSYKLQASADGGVDFDTVKLSSSTSTSIDRTLTNGRHYIHRVRATDREGNTSSYRASPPGEVVRYSSENARVVYTGSWSLKKASSAFGDSTRAASSPSRSATFTFSGSAVGWIVTRYTSSGKARVYVDDVLISTVDLDTKSTKYRQLVFQRHFPTVGTHTLKIVPVGDGRVDVDGFVIIR